MSREWTAQAHGETKVWVRDNIVYTRVSQGFNEQGILRYERLVLSHVPCERWVLLDTVEASAGLTPGAAKELTRVFKRFTQQQCVAIAEYAHSTFGRFLQQQVMSHLQLPTLVSSDKQKIDNFVTRYAKAHPRLHVPS